METPDVGDESYNLIYPWLPVATSLFYKHHGEVWVVHHKDSIELDLQIWRIKRKSSTQVYFENSWQRIQNVRWTIQFWIQDWIYDLKIVSRIQAAWHWLSLFP